ncbi:MAG: diguanylate cyclase domain-containing protein [Chromatocurvus sp.]
MYPPAFAAVPSGPHGRRGYSKRCGQCSKGAEAVARLGGDEFTISLENIETSHQVRSAASQILKRFSQKFQLGHRDIALSTRIGAALSNSHQKVDYLNSGSSCQLKKSGISVDTRLG